MYIQLNGIVVKETSMGECNRVINLLTDKRGIIKIFAKGVKSIRSKNSCMSQMFSYSELTLYEGRTGYTINESEVKEVFTGLGKDIYKLSLAQYFCEVMVAMAPKEEEAKDYLRLILNCFSYLENDKMNRDLIKSIFEMRLCTMSGYMPDLTGCRCCGQYNKENMYFSVYESVLVCGNCLDKSYGSLVRLGGGTLESLRHIAYAPLERLFSFKASDKVILSLSGITERYLLDNSYTRYKALDFYNSLNK